MLDIKPIYYIASVSISIIALAISIHTKWQNRKQLDVTIEDEIYWINNLMNEHGEIIDDKDKPLIFIKVVNPSPLGIAYFDLRIIDVENQKALLFLTQTALDQINSNSLYFGERTPYKLSRLNPPYSNYGVFPENSFTRIDLLFSPLENTKTIMVTFKVAIKTWRKNSFSPYRRKFKYYKKTFDISYHTQPKQQQLEK